MGQDRSMSKWVINIAESIEMLVTRQMHSQEILGGYLRPHRLRMPLISYDWPREHSQMPPCWNALTACQSELL